MPTMTAGRVMGAAMAKRRGADGEEAAMREYLVQWLGRNPADTTWVSSLELLSNGYEDMIFDFEQALFDAEIEEDGVEDEEADDELVAELRLRAPVLLLRAPERHASRVGTHGARDAAARATAIFL